MDLSGLRATGSDAMHNLANLVDKDHDLVRVSGLPRMLGFITWHVRKRGREDQIA